MPLEGRPVRWGVLGCGNISRDFVSAASALPTSESVFVACAARSKESAEKFAALMRKLPACADMRSYGSYGAALADPDVDIVYIGTLADTHEELAMEALDAGKHVLVEKPAALSAKGARRMVAKARDKGLFFMEGMWTRCFPAVRKARELINSGAIGEVVSVFADFGWPGDPDPCGPHARVLGPASGGVCMDIACYPIAQVLLASGGAKPAAVQVSGSNVPGARGEAIDWAASASMSSFAAPANPHLNATVMVTLKAITPEEAVFVGTKGSLRLHKAHTPDKLTVVSTKSRFESSETSTHYPWPTTPTGVDWGWNYPGSQGFLYQAQAVVEALRAGLTECPHWTLDECVTSMELVDTMRIRTRAAGMRRKGDAVSCWSFLVCGGK